MIVLGIETSCDETSAAVVADGTTILSTVVSSQIAIHRPYGGVVPELASRHHVENIRPIVEHAISQANISADQIDLVAVTCGPGLVGSLLVGILFARGFAEGLSCPVVGINHLEGHIYASIMEHSDLSFPFLTLLVSGGHTMLVNVQNTGRYSILGQTIDDAVGEAFDKVANMLDLGYPGGPVIDTLTKKADRNNLIPFPRPLKNSKSLDFSFSGLKTAVLYHIKNITKERPLKDNERITIAASFQTAVVDILMTKTFLAMKQSGLSSCSLAGGVAANQMLRDSMNEASAEHSVSVFLPSKEFCTDNAAMIACCAFFRWQQSQEQDLIFDVNPRLKL